VFGLFAEWLDFCFPPLLHCPACTWLLASNYWYKNPKIGGCGSSVLAGACGALGTLVPTGTSEVRLPLAISGCVAHECSVLVLIWINYTIWVGWFMMIWGFGEMLLA
jgi:hypothetical protein